MHLTLLPLRKQFEPPGRITPTGRRVVAFPRPSAGFEILGIGGIYSGWQQLPIKKHIKDMAATKN